MAHIPLFGHGYSPASISRAERVYVQAWSWRISHRAEWLSIIDSANVQAMQGQQICVANLIRGIAPQEYAPLIARWLVGEQPQLSPFIELRRSVFDLFTG